MSNLCVNNGAFLFPPPMDREHTLSGRYELPSRDGQVHVLVELHEDRADADAPGGITPEPASNVLRTPARVAATFIDSRYEVPRLQAR